MIDDGVIKFNHIFIEKTSAIPNNEFSKLDSIRKELYKLKLIGAYFNGIGFGNISQKQNYKGFLDSTLPQFLISGTQTGELPKLTGDSYTRVVNYNFEKNEVQVIGPIMASSESLTHASIYACSKIINSIIHIHSSKIWKGLLADNFPKIPKNIAYGTREMANFARSIVNSDTSNEFQLFAMEGHEEGIIFFHEDIDQCLNNVLSVYKKYCS